MHLLASEIICKRFVDPNLVTPFRIRLNQGVEIPIRESAQLPKSDSLTLNHGVTSQRIKLTSKKKQAPECTLIFVPKVSR